MHIQYFTNHQPPGTRTHQLGIRAEKVFLYTENEDFYDFFVLDVRFPTNWHQIGRLDHRNFSYSFPTLSSDAQFVYVLFLGISDDVTFGVHRFEVRNRKETVFLMSSTQADFQLFEVPLDHIKVQSGANGELVFWDRTIVQGEIPYWSVQLDEEQKTFSVRKNPIGTDGEASFNSSVFPVAFDSIGRCFAKLLEPRKMQVYTQEKWTEYFLPADQTLQEIFGTDGFPVDGNRSVRETFGTHGHRVGAMQTKLTFHDGDGMVVARVLHHDRVHTTARVELDHEKHEIRVRKLATFSLEESVSRMFYLIASEQFHVFLGVRNSAIVYVKSPSLEEIGGWNMQKMLMADGFEKEVSKISNYNELLRLSFEKYPDKV